MTTIEAPHYLLQMTERQFQDWIVGVATDHGWLHYHTYDSRRSDPGFPDLVLVKTGRPVLFYEVKTEKGRVSMAQQSWLGSLNRSNSQVKAMVVRPSDRDHIIADLTA